MNQGKDYYYVNISKTIKSFDFIKLFCKRLVFGIFSKTHAPKRFLLIFFNKVCKELFNDMHRHRPVRNTSKLILKKK